MDEVDPGQPAPPERAGDVLRAAREGQGLSVADIGARTRIPLRHLEAIEASDYAGLPSSTYAVGFTRAYARAVGVDEVRIAHMVRQDVAVTGRRAPEYEPYEMADPARVPSRGVAIVALGVALAVLILVGLWYGTDLFRGGAIGQGEGAVPAGAPIVAAPVPVAARAIPAPVAGQVTLVANDEIWMRVYDADNTTLYLGTMKEGEKFDVPPTARNPMINIGRPDKLTVTLNGAAVAPLGTGERAIKDVPVGAAALAARAAGTPFAQPTPPAKASSGENASHDRSDRKGDTADRPAKRKPTSKLTETQRANLDSAAHPPKAERTSSEP